MQEETRISQEWKQKVREVDASLHLVVKEAAGRKGHRHSKRAATRTAGAPRPPLWGLLQPVKRSPAGIASLT